MSSVARFLISIDPQRQDLASLKCQWHLHRNEIKFIVYDNDEHDLPERFWHDLLTIDICTWTSPIVPAFRCTQHNTRAYTAQQHRCHQMKNQVHNCCLILAQRSVRNLQLKIIAIGCDTQTQPSPLQLKRNVRVYSEKNCLFGQTALTLSSSSIVCEF